jgi:hypothetical protein
MSEATLDHRTLADELWKTNKQLVDALVRLELAAIRDQELVDAQQAARRSCASAGGRA